MPPRAELFDSPGALRPVSRRSVCAGGSTQSFCKREFVSPLRCFEKKLFELRALLRRKGFFNILVNQFALYDV